MIDWLVPFSVLPTLGVLGFLAVYRFLRSSAVPDLRRDLLQVRLEELERRLQEASRIAALPAPVAAASTPYRAPAPRQTYAPPALREITGLNGVEVAAMLQAAFEKVHLEPDVEVRRLHELLVLSLPVSVQRAERRHGNIRFPLTGGPDPAFDAAVKEIRRAMPVRVPDDETETRRM